MDTAKVKQIRFNDTSRNHESSESDNTVPRDSIFLAMPDSGAGANDSLTLRVNLEPWSLEPGPQADRYS